MRRVVTALFASLAALLLVLGIGVAEDTAKKTADEAARELSAALLQHHELRREAALLKLQLADLQERVRVAQTRLAASADSP